MEDTIYSDRESQPDNQTETSYDNIISRIVTLLSNEVGIEVRFGENANIDTPLQDFGVNSLKYVGLILAIEDEYNMQFDDDFHSNYKMITLRMITDVIKHQL
jgi:acyl carrier protein